MGFHFESFVMQLRLAFYLVDHKTKDSCSKKPLPTLNINQNLDLAAP